MFLSSCNKDDSQVIRYEISYEVVANNPNDTIIINYRGRSGEMCTERSLGNFKVNFREHARFWYQVNSYCNGNSTLNLYKSGKNVKTTQGDGWLAISGYVNKL